MRNDDKVWVLGFGIKLYPQTKPKSAPTYSASEKQEEREGTAKYRCRICGYVYDPEKVDTDSGIKPGTPFDQLPETWVCPVCGATKDQFEKTD